MQFVLSLPAAQLAELVLKAREETEKDFARQQWLALLPWMPKDGFISFDEFWRQVKYGNRPFSLRSKAEILAEAEAIRQAIKAAS